jgi:hypothetical protein
MLESRRRPPDDEANEPGGVGVGGMIEVNLTVRKTTPDASGLWLPEIQFTVAERKTPLVLSLDEAEELLEELAYCVKSAHRLLQEKAERKPSD